MSLAEDLRKREEEYIATIERIQGLVNKALIKDGWESDDDDGFFIRSYGNGFTALTTGTGYAIRYDCSDYDIHIMYHHKTSKDEETVQSIMDSIRMKTFQWLADLYGVRNKAGSGPI